MRIDSKRQLSGLVLDVDGVLWLNGALAPGANELVNTLRRNSIPFRLLTNDCTSSANTRFTELVDSGLALEKEELLTAPMITRKWLEDNGIQRILSLGEAGVVDDLGPVKSVKKVEIGAVVVGDYFTNYSRDDLEAAFSAIRNGAFLLAMQKNPSWWDGESDRIDNGFWVAGLEFATGKTAIITGKPSSLAYRMAADSMGISVNTQNNIVMVSDDAVSDLAGARSVGWTTVLCNNRSLCTSPEVDFVVSDLHDLIEWIGK